MLELLKNRNFMLVLTGKLVSLVGNAVYFIGLVWYVLSYYGESSGRLLSWVIIVSFIPTAVLGGVIGAVADRYNKKRIIVISDIISGTTVFLMTWFMERGLLNGWYLLCSTALLSVTTSTVAITVNSMIPEILDSTMLRKASSTTLFVDRVTRLLGLAFGGVLVGILGIRKVFLMNALSFIISAFLEMFIKYEGRQNNKYGSVENRSFMGDIVQVTGYIRQNKRFLRLMLVFTCVNFLWDPLLNVVLPYVMKNNFNITSAQFGLLEAALPLGFCLGAMLLERIKGFIEGDAVIFNSIIGLNSCLLILSIPIMFAFKLEEANWIVYFFIVILVLSGVFSAALNINISTTIHRVVPDNLRGKIWGVAASLITGLIPLGCGIAGQLLGRVPAWVFFIISVGGVYLITLMQPRHSFVMLEEKEEMSMQIEDFPSGSV